MQGCHKSQWPLDFGSLDVVTLTFKNPYKKSCNKVMFSPASGFPTPNSKPPYLLFLKSFSVLMRKSEMLRPVKFETMSNEASLEIQFDRKS